MMKFKTLALASAAAILAACATATPYQPAAKPGGSGYSQTKIQSDRFTVSFSGNSLTDRETVENYLLFRAAELAVDNGYESFALVDKDTEKNTRIVSTGAGFNRGFASYDLFYPGYGWRPYYGPYSRSRFRRGFGYDSFWDDFNSREVTKYKAYADIRLMRGNTENSYRAREVMENLGPTLVFPEVKN